MLLASLPVLLLISGPMSPLSDARGVHLVAAYPDAPVIAHTGGFGEPTCRVCHFDNPLNAPGGRVVVKGFPDDPLGGETYVLAVSVRHDALGLGGFQLTLRTNDGEQAGYLTATDERADVTTSDEGIQYAHHTLAGIEPTTERRARWTVAWTAPEHTGEVILHVVANAAKGDRSEFGDFIYADSLRAMLK